MAKIQNGQAIDLTTFSQAEAKVGDYKWSELEPIDFSAEHLGTWLLVNGQSCVGTLYHTITGKTTVPDATTNGAFIRQASGVRELGSYQEDAMQGHRHEPLTLNNFAGQGSQPINLQINNAPQNGFDPTTGDPVTDGTNGTPRTSDETRPKNIALNLYIKVNY